MYNKSDPKTIQEMFGSIAKQYDRANAILSFRLHKKWNSKLVSLVANGSDSFADLCCGTGDIAFAHLANAPHPHTGYLIDFCKEMLDCAQDKARQFGYENRHTLSYIEADVHQIPLPDASIGWATVAYGIRNVQNPKTFIQEVFRVLQPGGSFGILELTQPTNPILRAGHSVYLRTVLPLAGKLVTSNREAYQYLCNSIRAFVPPEDIVQLLIETGFDQVSRVPLSGGIATIILAKKHVR